MRNTPDLILPHADMANREFVLAPLAEIAPDVIPPNQKETILELLTNLQKRGVEK